MTFKNGKGSEEEELLIKIQIIEDDAALRRELRILSSKRIIKEAP